MFFSFGYIKFVAESIQTGRVVLAASCQNHHIVQNKQENISYGTCHIGQVLYIFSNYQNVL